MLLPDVRTNFLHLIPGARSEVDALSWARRTLHVVRSSGERHAIGRWITDARIPPDGPSRPRAASWQGIALERITDEHIDALEPGERERLIRLFEQFLEEGNPPTKKMMVSARLKRAAALRD